MRFEITCGGGIGSGEAQERRRFWKLILLFWWFDLAGLLARKRNTQYVSNSEELIATYLPLAHDDPVHVSDMEHPIEMG